MINKLYFKSIEHVVKWSKSIFLKINPYTAEIILFYPKSLQEQVIIKGSFVDNDCIRLSQAVKDVTVGVC